MICTKCGAKNRNRARFCVDCGEKIEIVSTKAICSGCGKTVTSKYKFCPYCGQDIRECFVITQPNQGRRKLSVGAKIVLLLTCLIILFSGLITYAIVLSINSDSKDVELSQQTHISPVNVSSNGTEREEEPTIADELGFEHYTKGVYRVGNDIPEGTYILIYDDENYNGYCYFFNAPSRAMLDDYSYSSAFYAFDVVYLEKGDLIKLKFCSAIPFIPEDWSGDNDVFKDDNGRYVDGGYLVGKTIPAGTFEVSAITRSNTQSDTSYIQVWDSIEQRRLELRQEVGPTTDNRTFITRDEPFTITLEEGQYIFCDAVELVLIDEQ